MRRFVRRDAFCLLSPTRRVRGVTTAAAPPGVLLTTPVFYVNSAPHVGHLYTSLLADATARYHRLAAGAADGGAPPPRASGAPGARLPAVALMTGTDEHGQKVAEAARAAAAAAARAAAAAARAGDAAAGASASASASASAGAPAPPAQLPPAAIRAFADGVAASFVALGDAFGVSPDARVRTTEPRHAATVAWLWRRLAARGQLERRAYAGWYCRSEEAFVPEAATATPAAWAARRGGRAPPGGAGAARVDAESGHAVEWVTEENYVFRLSEHREHLLRLLDGGLVSPPERAAFLRRSAAGGAGAADGGALVDLSVSRPASRVPWALRVPGDESQSVYVWLDALASYLTAARGPGAAPGDGAPLPDDADPRELFPLWAWPGRAVVHVVGKDIAKFHALHWPALLAGAGLPPPSRVVTHAHFTVDHVKMSKSLGNVVDPFSLVAPPGGGAPARSRHAPDAVRYMLLREGSHADDADFNAATLAQRAVKECAGTFGNLATRLATPKFAPLGRLLGPVGRVGVGVGVGGGGAGGSGAGAGDPRRDDGRAHELDAAALPRAVDLLPPGTPGGALLTPAGAFARLSRAQLRALWPEPELPSFGDAARSGGEPALAGGLPLSPAQAALLESLPGVAAAASAAYADARAGAALAAVMAALQDANGVLAATEPWHTAAREEDVAAWRAHAAALLARARALAAAAAARADAAAALAAARTPADADAALAAGLAAALGDALGGDGGGAAGAAALAPPPPPPPRFTREHAAHAGGVFAVLEAFRVACVLLAPAMPAAAPALLAHVGFPPGSRGAAWASAAARGAVAPHHFVVGRGPRGESPLTAPGGPAAGPVVFPQDYAPRKEGRLGAKRAAPAPAAPGGGAAAAARAA